MGGRPAKLKEKKSDREPRAEDKEIFDGSQHENVLVAVRK